VRSSRNAATAVFAASLLFCAPVHAQSSKCDTGPVVLRLVDRYTAECLKDNEALQKRKKSIESAFERKDEASASWPGRAREQFQLLLEEVQKRATSPPYADALKDSLNDAIVQLSLLPDMAALAARETFPSLQTNTWRTSVRPSRAPGGLAASHLRDTDARCVDENDPGTDPKCRAAFGRAVQVGDDVFIAGTIIAKLHAPEAKRFHDLAALREKRWHAYLYDTQFQYWWELGLNRYLEENCADRYLLPLIGKKCDKQERDKDKNPLGFREPPEYRAVFLHPDVGLQYLDAEPHGDRLKPALVIQWVGYQWWKWKENEAKINSLRGVSFVSTISDNASNKTIGWGAQIQLGEYAVAFTGHRSKLAITLNLQLGDKISKLNEEWADKLKRLKGQ
jgi:hypothetical protein